MRQINQFTALAAGRRAFLCACGNLKLFIKVLRIVYVQPHNRILSEFRWWQLWVLLSYSCPSFTSFCKCTTVLFQFRRTFGFKSEFFFIFWTKYQAFALLIFYFCPVFSSKAIGFLFSILLIILIGLLFWKVDFLWRRLEYFSIFWNKVPVVRNF